MRLRVDSGAEKYVAYAKSRLAQFRRSLQDMRLDSGAKWLQLADAKIKLQVGQLGDAIDVIFEGVKDLFYGIVFGAAHNSVNFTSLTLPNVQALYAITLKKKAATPADINVTPVMDEALYERCEIKIGVVKLGFDYVTKYTDKAWWLNAFQKGHWPLMIAAITQLEGHVKLTGYGLTNFSDYALGKITPMFFFLGRDDEVWCAARFSGVGACALPTSSGDCGVEVKAIYGGLLPPTGNPQPYSTTIGIGGRDNGLLYLFRPHIGGNKYGVAFDVTYQIKNAGPDDMLTVTAFEVDYETDAIGQEFFDELESVIEEEDAEGNTVFITLAKVPFDVTVSTERDEYIAKVSYTGVFFPATNKYNATATRVYAYPRFPVFSSIGWSRDDPDALDGVKPLDSVDDFPFAATPLDFIEKVVDIRGLVSATPELVFFSTAQLTPEVTRLRLYQFQETFTATSASLYLTGLSVSISRQTSFTKEIQDNFYPYAVKGSISNEIIEEVAGTIQIDADLTPSLVMDSISTVGEYAFGMLGFFEGAPVTARSFVATPTKSWWSGGIFDSGTAQYTYEVISNIPYDQTVAFTPSALANSYAPSLGFSTNSGSVSIPVFSPAFNLCTLHNQGIGFANTGVGGLYYKGQPVITPTGADLRTGNFIQTRTPVYSGTYSLSYTYTSPYFYDPTVMRYEKRLANSGAQQHIVAQNSSYPYNILGSPFAFSATEYPALPNISSNSSFSQLLALHMRGLRENKVGFLLVRTTISGYLAARQLWAVGTDFQKLTAYSDGATSARTLLLSGPAYTANFPDAIAKLTATITYCTEAMAKGADDLNIKTAVQEAKRLLQDAVRANYIVLVNNFASLELADYLVAMNQTIAIDNYGEYCKVEI